jgi:cell division protein ZapE
MHQHPLLATYLKHCQAGELTWDTQQQDVLEQLAPLFDRLHRSKLRQWFSSLLSLSFPRRRESIFSSLDSRLRGNDSKSGNDKDKEGAYLYGEAGRGKTALMDLFYACSHVPKKRVHFHEFMQMIHHARHQHRMMQDPPLHAVQSVCGDIRLLCLDEMEVKDIGDALILGRTLELIFASGVVLITTSNRPIGDLYLGGLHRDRFEPTIALLERTLLAINLNSPIDYRLRAERTHPHSFWPLDKASQQRFEAVFEELTHHMPLEPYTVTAWERPLTFETHAQGVLKATFAQLCGSPLSSGDYLALVSGVNTLLLDEVPALQSLPRDELRRFILLIDVLYDKHTKLFMRTEEPLGPLEETLNTWGFEFQRTYSRLMEMQNW